MAQEQQVPQGQIQIKMDDQIMKGVYANEVGVSHTKDSFIIDFLSILPSVFGLSGTVNSRIIILPANMKRVVTALKENLERYESQFGDIKNAVSQPDATTTSSSDHKMGFDINKTN